LTFTVNCTKFVQLILKKIIQIFAARCHIIRLKFTEFDFGTSSLPDLGGEAYSVSPDPL